MKSYTEIPCDTCHKPVQIESRYVKYNRKNNPDAKFFCGAECRKVWQRPGQDLQCETCGKDIYKTPKELADSKHYFCSQSCSATFTNKNRVLPRGKKKTLQCVDCSEIITVSVMLDPKQARCKTCSEKRKQIIRDYNAGKICDINCSDCNKIFSGYERYPLCPECVYLQGEEYVSLNGQNYFVMVFYTTCITCNTIFYSLNNNTKCCSKLCLNQRRVQVGQKSAQSQSESRRSKNEIHFARLCSEHYTIKQNETLFNGWDADVILPDLKVAVLWNGNWHHKKITKKHSVKQVQNRDRIKQKEIINAGYIPYVIDDFGKENPKFVEDQFGLFMDWLQLKTSTL